MIDLKNVKVEDIIAHRDRMKLVHEILEVEHDSALTSSTANDQWPLYKDGHINSLVCVELAAQTAGICSGFNNMKKENKTTGESGWLVGIKKASFYKDSIPVNSKITTFVKKVYEFDKYVAFEGNIKVKNELIGDVVLQVLSSE